MKLPFTTEQFFQVFRDYNQAVWPVQLLLVGLALGMIALLFRPAGNGSRLMSAGLAFLWFWLAIGYHLTFFVKINPAARLFGALCIVASGLFFWHGVINARLSFRGSTRMRRLTGAALITYALAIYPLVNLWSGHTYPAVPTFGLPCPTTIFTLGLLFFAESMPAVVLIVPLLWAAIGSMAAFQLGVPADFGLLVAGVVGASSLLLRSNRRQQRTTEQPAAELLPSRAGKESEHQPVLVLYATRDGQTRKIANYVADHLRQKLLDVDVVDAGNLPGNLDLSVYSSAILAASVNYGKHQPEMIAFIREHRCELRGLTTAFLSVSGAQGGAEDHSSSDAHRSRSAATAMSMIERFLKDTGWQPSRVMPVAGAMNYMNYGWMLRLVIRVMARLSGAKIDTTRNTEYTNWTALDRFCDSFHAELKQVSALQFAA